MDLVIEKSQPLVGEINNLSKYPLPGDKSISHRAIILGAIADGASSIENALIAGTTNPLLEILPFLGIRWAKEGNTIIIEGHGFQSIRHPSCNLNCGNSATSMRLLAGALSATNIPAVLDGSDSLRMRPMGRIVEPLRLMGVTIESASGGKAPLRIFNRPTGMCLRPINYEMPVPSAQVKSCLLIAALGSDGISVIREPVLSRNHTELMLASMGVNIHTELVNAGKGGTTIYLTPPQSSLRPLNIRIPADLSAASFIVVASLITPYSDVTLRGVCVNQTRTGIIDVLQRMGAQISVNNIRTESGEVIGDINSQFSPLRGVKISGPEVVRMIDELPILAIAASCAEGETVVSDSAELHHKESDRIYTLTEELSAIGIRIKATEDGFIISGNGQGHNNGGAVCHHNDHRLALSLAVAGLVAHKPILIPDAEIMDESFPKFHQLLGLLGANIYEAQN